MGVKGGSSILFTAKELSLHHVKESAKKIISGEVESLRLFRSLPRMTSEGMSFFHLLASWTKGIDAVLQLGEQGGNYFNSPFLQGAIGSSILGRSIHPRELQQTGLEMNELSIFPRSLCFSIVVWRCIKTRL